MSHPARNGFPGQASLIFLCPTSSASYDKQPSVMPIIWVNLGASEDLTNNSKGCILCLVLRFSMNNSALGGAVFCTHGSISILQSGYLGPEQQQSVGDMSEDPVLKTLKLKQSWHWPYHVPLGKNQADVLYRGKDNLSHLLFVIFK